MNFTAIKPPNCRSHSERAGAIRSASILKDCRAV